MKKNRPFSTEQAILIRGRTCRLLCFGILLPALLFLLKSFSQEPARTYIRLTGLRNILVSSTEYPYFSFLDGMPNSTLYKEKTLFYKTAPPIPEMPCYDHYTFTFLYEDQKPVYFLYSPAVNKVYNTTYNLLEPSSELKEMLLDLTALYRQEIFNTYGALFVWDDVNKKFPMYAIAKITDIYTGASFEVQRREGSNHVDAQPLTAEDTAIMKTIFGGRWSWERKGIVVEVPGYRIAASMNGMPHGAGKIDDNNFPGHFCIHFLGSTIHSGGMDILHHREILKAAGKLPKD